MDAVETALVHTLGLKVPATTPELSVGERS
jgi:hypothetical protein